MTVLDSGITYAFGAEAVDVYDNAGVVIGRALAPASRATLELEIQGEAHAVERLQRELIRSPNFDVPALEKYLASLPIEERLRLLAAAVADRMHGKS